MLACHNTNTDMQTVFAKVRFLVSSTLQLSAHTIYKEENEEKIGFLQCSVQKMFYQPGS